MLLSCLSDWVYSSYLDRVVVDGVGHDLLPLCGMVCLAWIVGSEVWGEPECVSAVRQVFGCRLFDVLA